MNSLDLDRAAETFASAPDLTVGVEEEFSILDPQTLELVPRFEQLRGVAAGDRLLREGITGELISSEIEIRSGRGEDLASARRSQSELRRRLFSCAAEHAVEAVDSCLGRLAQAVEAAGHGLLPGRDRRRF